MRHILSANDFKQEDLDTLFEWADKLKDWPTGASAPSFNGKILGSLFFEPSTRTRWSTESAMIRLGGQVLSMEYAKESSSDRKGESLRDTIKTCSQYVDALVVRHPAENSIQDAAPFSDCPVINGGDGSNEHPTQALLDVYTITRNFKSLENKRILFTGDLECSRTIHSLAKMLVPYGLKISAERKWWEPNIFQGDTIFLHREELYNALPLIDILYMTRHQTERAKPREQSQFMLTKELAHTMKKDAIIMHPLPRTQELHPDVDTNPRAKYFEQAKNGMWIRMALLFTLLSST